MSRNITHLDSALVIGKLYFDYTFGYFCITEYHCIFSVGGTVLAGGLAATGVGLVTGNNDLTNAGLTSTVVGGGITALGKLFGKK